MDSKLDVYRKSGVLSSPHIDIFRDHYYVAEDDGDYSRRSLEAVNSLKPYGKAFVITEVGFSSLTMMRKLMTTIINTPRITGASVWSLRTHSFLGGYYIHKEKDSWLSYRLPGYPTGTGGPSDEIGMMNLVREFALKIQEMDATARLPRPSVPQLLPIPSPLYIRWKGSAMAYEYKFARAVLPLNATGMQDPPLDWDVLELDYAIQDSAQPGLAFFTDLTAPCNVRLFYSVAAVSEGGWSEWSAPEMVIDPCPDEDWEPGSPLPWEGKILRSN
ncbi:hypothetical protein HDU67_008529 [Dinochytrium kinnereticum]|nr:hypothetical protein HDU67_008529 [Dinochytrium kinnereticum]